MKYETLNKTPPTPSQAWVLKLKGALSELALCAACHHFLHVRFAVCSYCHGYVHADGCLSYVSTPKNFHYVCRACSEGDA